MSRRADLLAARIEEGAARLAAFAEGLSDIEWGTPTSPTDRRTVGQIVNHVALVYPIEIDLASVPRGESLHRELGDDVEISIEVFDHGGRQVVEAALLNTAVTGVELPPKLRIEAGPHADCPLTARPERRVGQSYRETNRPATKYRGRDRQTHA